MTKLERKAAMIVAAATAGVIVSGVRLMKRHTRYLAKKAAATFGPDDGENPEETEENTFSEDIPENSSEESQEDSPEETSGVVGDEKTE